MMTRRLSLILSLVFAVVLFFSINVIADALFRTARLDLTENNLYTLSDGTRQILTNLEEPITLRFYFSDELANQFPQIETYARRVRDILEEYSAIAGEEIRLEVINPEPFSQAEDDAVAYGLSGIPTGTGDSLYFGLVGVNSTDRQEVIEVFDQSRERFLEYDLTRLVQNLSRRERAKIGLLSSLPLSGGGAGPVAAMQGGGQRPYTVYQQLTNQFDVTEIRPNFQKLDSELDVLIIAHPPQLNERQLFAIDQFILRGGRALVLVDPYSETAATQQPRSPQAAAGRPPRSSNLAPLFDAWGLGYTESEVVGDISLAQRVAMSQDRSQVQDYVIWLRLSDSNLSERDIVTGNLSNMLLASSGYFTTTEKSPVTFEPVITTTDQATVIPKKNLSLRPQPAELLRGYQPSGETFTLAARLSGTVPSAFPDGPPELKSEATTEKDIVAEQRLPEDEILSESAGPINVMVVADTDFLADRFWVRRQSFLGQELTTPTADNGAFLLNAVENLTGSEALISLRSRGTSNRPFEVVDRLRREAEQQYLAEEQRLQERLEKTEQRIANLQSQGGEGGLYLTPEQQKTVEKFRQQALQTRAALRKVQRRLREDIESLATNLRIINIALMPLLVAVVAVILGVVRQRRYKRSRRSA